MTIKREFKNSYRLKTYKNVNILNIYFNIKLIKKFIVIKGDENYKIINI